MTGRRRTCCRLAGLALLGASIACMASLAAAPAWQAAAGSLGCAAAGIPLLLAAERDDDIDALINATRELRCPDHVPAEWVKEHRK